MTDIGILCIGDPHFKSDNGETTQMLTEKICDLIKEKLEEIDAVAILGDILHRHEKVDLHPFYRAMTFLQKIHDIITSDKSKENIFLYILIGNHDRSNNQVFMTDEHVFNPLKLWKNTIVADRAVIHNLKKDYSVLLVPYVPPGRFNEAISTVCTDEHLKGNLSGKNEDQIPIGLVLAHQEFHGAKMNTITSNEGDPWPSLFPLCVSGHIHDYQKLAHNLVYTGTPIQHGFADSGKKTVSFFKIFRGNVQGPRYEEERIDLKIKGKTQIKTHVSNISSLSIPLDDFFVKIKAEGKKSEIKAFTSSKTYRDYLSLGVVFQFLELPTVPEDLNIGKRELKINYSLSSRLKEIMDKTDDLEVKNLYTKIFN